MKQMSMIILALVVATTTIFMMCKKSTEGFWNIPARAVVAQKIHSDDNGVSFYQTPNYQMDVSPRFSGDVNYGPRIRYEFPSSNVMPHSTEQAPDRKQTITYDRHIYANKKSRLRALGDPLRGDLPIIPFSGGWYAPAVQPSLDLHAGAVSAMGGINNENSLNVAKLIYETGGRVSTAIGGVDLQTAMLPKNEFTSNWGTQDVTVTAFP